MNFIPCISFPNDPEHMHLLDKPCPKCGAAGAQQAAQSSAAVCPVVAPDFNATMQASSPTNGAPGGQPRAVCLPCSPTTVIDPTNVARFSATRSDLWETLAIWAGAFAACVLQGLVLTDVMNWHRLYYWLHDILEWVVPLSMLFLCCFLAVQIADE